MEPVKAGEELKKIVVTCTHCKAEWKTDHRYVLFHCLNYNAGHFLLRWLCRHCGFHTGLTSEQALALGISRSMVEDSLLTLQIRNQEKGRRYHIKRPPASPTAPLPASDPQQRTDAPVPASRGSLDDVE